MADWLKLIPAAEARRILLEVPPVGTESARLHEAVGRVLAAPLVAPHDLPPARLAAMDGYAVRASDVTGAAPGAEVVLRVIGSVPAGSVFAGQVGAGEAVAIATGALVPDGADAVVMVEHTAAIDEGSPSTNEGLPSMNTRSPERRYLGAGARVRVSVAVASGANAIQPGEDLRAGVPILPVGRRLRPGDLAALAAFGVVDVAVFRRPRIAVLATGSEICPPEQTPRPGQVRDSNQYVLGAEIESTGAIAVRGGIVADDRELLQQTVLRLVAEHDGVILSGGSSVGPKDLTGQVLNALQPPGVLFHGVDIRPGKPTVFARAGHKPVVGMPGYPTSSMVVFEALIRPMLARLGGEAVTDAWPAATRARLARPHTKPISREDYLRVRLSTQPGVGVGDSAGVGVNDGVRDGDRDGELWAHVLPGGSGAISNVIFADGLARIPAGTDRLEQGAFVAVRRFAAPS